MVQLVFVSKSLNTGHCELERLACSIYYDLKGGHSSREVRGGVQLVLDEA
jgi:hypothetical protein